MSPRRERRVFVLPSPGIKESYTAFKRLHPEIVDAVKIFNAYKREIPPRLLPREMKDHALKGALKGIRECHLNGLTGDVLLLYTHKNDEVRMLAICRHADLHGRRGRALKKRLEQQVA
ncbi:MAG: type II toxin-antitoxin system mRNA interferase toxin, RelE/StbE family [Alphaproteobacteria bacterium]|nr:type II toxin-antitoxin system mRNA interferase toxin, RelE/StbE family [Alphaproteobacteria bacterium]